MIAVSRTAGRSVPISPTACGSTWARIVSTDDLGALSLGIRDRPRPENRRVDLWPLGSAAGVAGGRHWGESEDQDHGPQQRPCGEEGGAVAEGGRWVLDDPTADGVGHRRHWLVVGNRLHPAGH